MAEFGSLAPDVGPVIDAPGAGPEDATVRLLRMMRARQMQVDPLGSQLGQAAFGNTTGLLNQPQAAPPMASAPGKTPSTSPWDDPRIPGAMMEMGTMFPAGRVAMGSEFAGRLIPEAMQNLSGAASPVAGRAVTGASLASILHGDANAGDEFKWTDANADRVKEIGDIEKRIADRNKKIGEYTDRVTTLGTTKTPSPKGTQDKAIDNLKASIEAMKAQNAEDAPDVKRLGELRDQQNTAQGDAFEQFKKQRWAETSLFDMVPGTRQAITVGSPMVSYLGGKYLGKRLPLGAALPAAGVKGGFEGFAGQYYPNEMDIGLPDTSPAYKRAISNATDPNFWTRVGLATGGGTLAGMLGAGTSAAARRPVIPMQPLPGSGPARNPGAPPQTSAAPPVAENTPAAPPMPPPAAAAATPQSPVDLTQFAADLERPGKIMSGGQTLKQASDGTWRNNGKFAATPPEALPLDPFTSDMGKTLRYWATLPPQERAARVQQLLRDRPELRSILGDLGSR